MIRTTEQKVEHILRNYPETRSDDFKLISAFYFEYYGVHSLYEIARIHEQRKMVAFETITRCRRKLQNKYQELNDIKGIEKRIEQENRIIDYVRGTDLECE